MFGLAIATMLALTAALIGGVTLAVGEQPAVGATALAIGVAVAIWGTLRIVHLNRAWQLAQRADVLADPARIVARWGSGAGEVILHERGLVLGEDFVPFAAAYQALRSAELAGEKLVLELDVVGADGTIRREVVVPAEALAAVRGFVARRGQAG